MGLEPVKGSVPGRHILETLGATFADAVRSGLTEEDEVPCPMGLRKRHLQFGACSCEIGIEGESRRPHLLVEGKNRRLEL